MSKLALEGVKNALSDLREKNATEAYKSLTEIDSTTHQEFINFVYDNVKPGKLAHEICAKAQHSRETYAEWIKELWGVGRYKNEE